MHRIILLVSALQGLRRKVFRIKSVINGIPELYCSISLAESKAVRIKMSSDFVVSVVKVGGRMLRKKTRGSNQ